MIKSKFGYICLLSVFLFLLSGCDPIYPMGKLRVEPFNSIKVGEVNEIRIKYPTGSIGVIGWKDQTIEIVSNSNVISVSGLMITGIEAGTATIKVSATTILAKGAYDDGHEERIYSVQMKITVK
jgi:hypothetical protein